MVVSPEHPYLDKYKDEIKNWDEIESYREQASRSQISREQSLQG